MTYGLPITCLKCGRPVRHVASGTSDGHTTSAIVACHGTCGEWIVTATMTSRAAAHRRERELDGYSPPTTCGTARGARCSCGTCRSNRAAGARARKNQHRQKEGV